MILWKNYYFTWVWENVIALKCSQAINIYHHFKNKLKSHLCATFESWFVLKNFLLCHSLAILYLIYKKQIESVRVIFGICVKNFIILKFKLPSKFRFWPKENSLPHFIKASFSHKTLKNFSWLVQSINCVFFFIEGHTQLIDLGLFYFFRKIDA